MTTKNSILLMVKQSDGTSLHELFNKIVGNYSNPNSARAALSRAVKDLNALGLVHRAGSSIFLTKKGLREINKEMKNKLLLKLNEIVLKKDEENADAIVAKLSTLIERSKQDADLLKVARHSSEFFLSDLKKIQANLEKKISHLNYLQKILSEQIIALEKMNFKERKILSFEKKSFEKILTITKKQKPKQLIIESKQEFLPMIQHHVGGERKKDFLYLETKKLKKLLKFLEKEFKKEHDFPLTVAIIFSGITLTINRSSIALVGPNSKITHIK